MIDFTIMQVGDIMLSVDVANVNYPSIFRELYQILKDGMADDSFKNHTLTFRCNNCEDVIEFRFINLKTIFFEKDYMKILFDDSSVWLTPYDNVVDIWIEQCIIDDGQKTLFEV